MRIALLGNLANTAYAYTQALRNEGLKADVFITEKERKQVTTYPEWEDPEINSINSNWIHYYEQRNPISLFQTMTKLRSYDLIHAFGLPNIYCQFLGRPLITHALGADLKEVVYESGLTGYLLKRAFLRSKCVLFSDIDHIPHVNRLRLSQAQYFPAAVYINKYHPEVQARHTEKDKIILLHSSFLDWMAWKVSVSFAHSMGFSFHSPAERLNAVNNPITNNNIFFMKRLRSIDD